MVKETNFGKQPVRLEKGLFLGLEQKDLCGINLDLLAAALANGSVSTTPWDLMDVGALAVTGGTVVPKNAKAVILHVYVKDSGSAASACSMAFAKPGIIVASKSQFVFCGNVNSRYGSALMIVELNDDDKIAYKVTASGGASFDYIVNLIGWVIGGTRLSKGTMPYSDLKCKFSVNQ